MTEGPRDEAGRRNHRGEPEGSAGLTPDQVEALLKSTSPESHPPGPEATEEEHIGTFHALRYRNYRLLWIGDLLTAAAMWMQQTALGWVVYDLTGSGQILGAVNAVRIIPTLFFSPVAGVATDLLSRNRIIAISQFVMFLLTFVVALDLAFGQIQIWHLFVFTILIGTAQTFNMPARQTFIFELLPRRVIPNAVALSWFAFSVARAAGPTAGGLLIVHFGPSENFFLQSVAFLSVMITVLLVRAPARPQPAERRSFFHSLREGYGFVFSEPRARIMLLMSLISPLLIIPLHAALLPIFAKTSFHTDAGGLGVLVGSLGFGGLFGGLISASLTQVDRRGLLQLAALFVFSLSETAFSILAYLTGDLYIAVPFLVLAGAAESIYTTSNTAMLQLLAPDHLRGSMAAVLQLGFLFMPIGSLAAGTAADVFGAPAVGATITFAAFCVGLAILIFSAQIRRLRLSEITHVAQPAAGAGRGSAG